MVIDLRVPLNARSRSAIKVCFIRLAVLIEVMMEGAFRSYLGFDVVKGRGRDNGEANKKYVSLRIRQRPQSVVIFLSGGIPKSQADGLAINHYARRVVIESRRWCGVSVRPCR